jgi:thioredoxin
MRTIGIALAASLLIILAGCDGGSSDVKSSSKSNTAQPAKEIPRAEPDTKKGMTADAKPVHLTKKSFMENVWDYEKSPNQWQFRGELPCIIDFYADWCRPCRMVAPIMDELAKKYEGRVNIYKINTEQEKELARVFQVQSIPMVVFAPLNGKPATKIGAMSKEDYIKIVEEFLLNQGKSTTKQ